MKKRIKIFVLYAIFWMAFFTVARIIFLFYQYEDSFQLPVKEWFLIMLHGLKLDISATGYLLTFAGLFITFTIPLKGKYLNYILTPFTIIFLIIFSVIIIGDLELYKNWGYRIDTTPLLYLKNPKEAAASTELWLEIVLLISTIIFVGIFTYLYKKIFVLRIKNLKKQSFLFSFVCIIITASMIIPVRGGIGIAPINTGAAYFSKNIFSNHAAINAPWNLGYSLSNMDDFDKGNKFFEDSSAEKLFNDVQKESDTFTRVLNKENPNVVIILLESFTSKVIGVLNNKYDVTSNLDSLSHEGILFNNFYANSDRSDKGIVAILSGFPAHPTSSIIKYPTKTQSLAFLNQSFENKGYKSSFYYGGDIDFANMRSYFINGSYDDIISKEDFDSELYKTKWGVHDEDVLERFSDEIISDTNKFFKVCFTLSSHDPFDVPMKTVIKGKDRQEKFMNSVFYTDKCIGDFFNKVSKSEIWDNTLFILVADHGSQHPDHSPSHSIEKHKIPMIWLGGCLSETDTVIETFSSQIDIPATVLNQLNIESKDFKYSKNIFADSSVNYGFYTYNNGFAYITKDSRVIFNNVSKEVINKNDNYEENDLKTGKAILQMLTTDFDRQ
jgi:phosphoglycerol transferase MdoB-like AlkP superfamily enzyme